MINESLSMYVYKCVRVPHLFMPHPRLDFARHAYLSELSLIFLFYEIHSSRSE